AERPLRRYHAGRNTTGWQSVEISPSAPREWTVVTRDLWQDFGDFTLTGIAPTAMGGDALFDQIELLQIRPTNECTGSRLKDRGHVRRRRDVLGEDLQATAKPTSAKMGGRGSR